MQGDELTLKNNTTMKTTLTTYQAADILANDADSSFTRAGAFALVEHLENIEEETGEEMDFDSVGIRCDWGEYANLMEWGKYHFADMMDAISKLNLTLDGDGRVANGDAEVDDKIRDFIRESGELIEFDDGVIVSNF